MSGKQRNKGIIGLEIPAAYSIYHKKPSKVCDMLLYNEPLTETLLSCNHWIKGFVDSWFVGVYLLSRVIVFCRVWTLICYIEVDFYVLYIHFAVLYILVNDPKTPQNALRPSFLSTFSTTAEQVRK